MTPELMLAILSMDSYNQGMLRGLEHGNTQIGNASLLGPVGGIPSGMEASWSAAGFYAAAYNWNGQTVISYRGTDNPSPLAGPTGPSDVLNGWVSAVGFPASQIDLAEQFYNSVTGSTYLAGPAANTILTGHSLGGGLAGYMAALSGTQAQLFDHMPFGLIAALRWALGSAAVVAEGDWPTTLQFSQISSTFTEGEILQLARNPSTSFIISQLLYGNPIPGLLSATLESHIAKTALLSHADPLWSINPVDRAMKLHMMDLLVNLQFAKDNINTIGTEWHAVGKELWNAYFNDAVANAIGMLPGGTSGPAGKMGRAIAYSAIDEGTRVFGDSGIRAMFNDARDLGTVVQMPLASQTVLAAKASIAEILVQFAGQLAFGKVAQTVPGSITGVLTLSPDNSVLTVDFNDALWSLGRTGAPPTILGRDTLIDTALGVAGSKNISDLRSGMDWLWGNAGTSVIDRIAFATNDTSLTYTIPERTIPSPKVTLTAAGGGADNITGSSTQDFIFGGDGNDTINGAGGNDLVAGGKGDDTITGSSGNDYVAGGDGVDTFDYNSTPPTIALSTPFIATNQPGAPAGSGNFVIDLTATSGTDRLVGIEKVVLSSASDTITNTTPIKKLDFAVTFDGLGGTQDHLDFSGKTSGIYLGHKNPGLFSYNSDNSAVEVFESNTNPLSWLQWAVSIVMGDAGAAGNYSLKDPTGVRFTNFEKVTGTEHDDVLGLWQLSPGGEVTPSDLAAMQAARQMPYYSESVNEMAYLAAQRALAAGAIAKNQIQVSIDGDEGNDVIVGTRLGINTIDGGQGNDRLYGSSFASTLKGGEGDDKLYANGAFETSMFGGGGKDVFHVSHNTFIKDADDTDWVVWGGLPLTGGVTQWWNEGEWAYWSPITALTSNLGIGSVVAGGFLNLAGAIIDGAAMLYGRYAVNGENQLVAQMAGGLLGQIVIDNYSFNFEKSTGTANLAVLEILNFKQPFSSAEFRKFLNAVTKQGFGCAVLNGDPMVIDLDGDGLELTRRDNGTYFDIDNDGFAELSAWVQPDDGFLARDANGNGIVDNQSELFGNATTTAHLALKAFDSNNDNIINTSDTVFSTLRIWRDLDGDGVTDAGELQTLAQAGIVSIGLTTATPAIGTVSGNPVRAESTVTRADGSTTKAYDVVLANSQSDSKWLGTSTVSTAAAALPNLKGYGNVRDLRVAMTDDTSNSLLNMVTTFKNLTSASTWTDLKAAADDILFKWAGVDTVPATAMTANFDERKLAFLEKYTGDALVPRTGGVPTLIGINELVALWDDVLSTLTVRLAAQGPMATLFGNLTLDAQGDTFKLATAGSLSSIYVSVLQQLSATPATALSQWNATWGPMLRELGDTLLRHNNITVKTDFEIASLIKAMTQQSTPLTLTQLVSGMGLEHVFIGTDSPDTLNPVSTIENNVFVGGLGNDTLNGGNKQDVFVFGTNFGVDTINETFRDGVQSGDRIRFATLNASDVTFSRSGNDLVISVNGTSDKVIVKDQFASPAIYFRASQAILDNGVEDIQFADGKVMEFIEIATALGMGTAQSETLTGTSRTDYLRGLGGDDTMLGGDHGDIYFYSSGDGHDTINDIMSTYVINGADILALLNFAPDMVRYERIGASNDLKLTFVGVAGSVIIENQFAYNEFGYSGDFTLNSRIESLFFEGGNGIGWQDVQQLTIHAYTTSGNDTTYGYGTGDEFGASAGNDTLVGFDGGDTYHFGKGSGQDIIDDRELYGANVFTTALGSTVDFSAPDVLKFGAGISLANLTFTRANGGDDLVVGIAGTTDQITIKDQFKVYNIVGLFQGSLGQKWSGRVEMFTFSNGTSLTWQQVLEILTTGTSGDDSLYGAFSTDVLDGKAGSDYLQGREEGDTYTFGIGDGSDVVEDRNLDPYSTGADTLLFKSGVAVGQVSFAIGGPTGTDLIVTINGTSDQVVIKNQFGREDGFVFGEVMADRIETFRWADGTTKTWSQIRDDILAASSTSGNDTIRGTSFGETFDGGAGDDTMIGFDGDDTYLFGIGSGNDTVVDTTFDYNLSVVGDRILIGSGVLPTGVTVERAAGEGIRLKIVASGDTLTIQDAYAYNLFGPKPNEVETVEFSNGTKWTANDLRSKTLLSQVTSGNDMVRGFFSDDVVTGGGGADTLMGGDGSDTYRLNANDGTDQIIEADTNNGYKSDDTLELASVFTTTNIQLSNPVGTFDLVITFTGRSETVTIKDQFKPSGLTNSSSATRVEKIAFLNASGTAIATWTDADVRQKLMLQAKTSGDDIINAFYGDETLDGGAGNDMLRGGNGNDTYVFSAGSDVIEEISDLGARQYDVIQFAGTRASYTFSKVGNDLKIVSGGDQLIIKDHFNSLAERSRVEKFTFSGGVTLTYQDINSELGVAPSDGALLNGTSASETLLGTAGNDIIAGRKGNDTIDLKNSNAGLGDDTVIYASGDGNDTIEDTGPNVNGGDVLKFTDLNLEDVEFSKVGSDIVVRVKSTNETVTLKNQPNTSFWYVGIDKIQFADGTVVANTETVKTLNDLAVTRGTSGGETITGNATGTGFDTGAGNDTVNDLFGGAVNGGSDWLYWGAGDGNDIWRDTTTLVSAETDTLKLKKLTPNDVTLSRNGLDLRVTITATGEFLTLVDQFKDNETEQITHSGIERIEFSDGTVFDRIEMQKRAPLTGVTGLSGHDTLVSQSSSAETLSGKEGNDIYLVKRNSGVDTINDDAQSGPLASSTADRIVFDAGIDPADVLFTRSGTSLVIAIRNTTDQVTVIGQFNAGANTNTALAYKIDLFQFADGTTITAADMVQITTTNQATTGADTIIGYEGSEVLDGGLGADTLRGMIGGDRYIVGRTSGGDQIDDQGAAQGSVGGTDVIEFASDIEPAHVVFSRSGNNLLIAIMPPSGTTPDATITVVGMLNADSIIANNQQIDEFRFADGTVLSAATVKAMVISQSVTGNAETVTGYHTDDVLTGGAGTDTLTGKSGHDTYVFGRGDGTDTVFDEGLVTDRDTLIFKQGILPNDVSVGRSVDGKDLLLTINGTQDRVTVKNQFDLIVSSQIEEVRFDDGTTWSASDIRNLLFYTLATANNDTIVGFGDQADTIDGLAGDDVIQGLGGADRLIGGNGIDTASYASSNYAETVDLALLTAQVSLPGSEAAGDILTGFENVVGSWGNDTFSGDGAANTLDGASGNDALYGRDGDDTLKGGAGADTLNGGAGNDTYIFETLDSTADTVDEALGAGTDTIRSSISLTSLAANVERLILEGSGIINGTGNGLDNTITGNTSVNVLTGGLGNDTIDGASGTDTAVFTGAVTNYTVEALSPAMVRLTDTRSTGNEGIDTVDNVENFQFSGGTFTFANLLANKGIVSGTLAADTALNGTTAVNTIYGFAGNDVINGLAGIDTLYGGEGDDTYVFLSADGVADSIVELSGTNQGNADLVRSQIAVTLAANVENLTLEGTAAVAGTGNALDNIINGSTNSAANALSGGGGNDTYIIGTGDTIIGEAVGAAGGIDTVQSAIAHTLATNVENLTLTGTTAVAGTGNTGDNVLNGSTNTAANALSGGTGNDTYIIGTGDTITGEAAGGGIDSVQSSVTHTLGAQIENLTLTGTSAVNGTGSALANVIAGNSSTNVINGAAGNDILSGGAAGDFFVFNSVLNATTNVDKLMDFNVTDDTIRLENTGAGLFTAFTATGAIAATALALNTTGQATTAAHRIIYDTDGTGTGEGLLYYDADGSGAGARILFAKTAALNVAFTNADFVVI